MKNALFVVLVWFYCLGSMSAQVVPFEARRPQSDADLRFWLENCLWHHGFSEVETSAALGLSPSEIAAAMERLGMDVEPPSKPPSKFSPLKVLPYPGGRHPRVGFLEGAVRPQRETKISVFAPWDVSAYGVVDVPEAIWSQKGLYYLAHTHIPTVWSEKKITLPKLEWMRHADGSLQLDRTFPDQVVLQTWIRPLKSAVVMHIRLSNGGNETLSDLRVQNCVMLKGLPGFNPGDESKLFKSDAYIALSEGSGTRWIITSWLPVHRLWQNPPVPCIHADPKFPDCPPGKSVEVQGWFSFFEGSDVEKEIGRIEALNWPSWALDP